jgi:UDP-glucuronate decarboxylase
LLDPIISSDLALVKKRIDAEAFHSQRILITGGAGFIGSWVSDVLASSQAAVQCVDNLSTGLKVNIEHLLHAPNVKFTFRKLDVAETMLRRGKYDLVLHLGSRASPEEYQQHPIETLAANSLGTKNLLEFARMNDAVFLYASTSEVYGSTKIIPTPETDWGSVNPIGLRSCYDEGKRFGEALCMAYHRAYGLDVRIVRLFNTYGPRLRADGLYGRSLSRFVDQALYGRDITVYGKGDQTRSFCYITDSIAALILVAQRKEMKAEAVNIGNPNEVKILDLAEMIKRITDSKSRIVFLPMPADDPPRRCPDISKAKRILGWIPTMRLEDGLKKTIEWVKKNRA